MIKQKIGYIEKKWCLFILLIVINFAMVYGSLYGIREINEETEQVLLQPESYIEIGNGQCIGQEFQILKDDNITTEKTGIAVKKQEQNSGFLRIKILQNNEVVQTEEIAFPDLETESYFDIGLDIDKFSEGAARLELIYIGFNSKDTILIMAGQGQLDLEKASLDGEVIDQSLALKLTYQISELSKEALYVRKILLVCLSVLLIAATYLFCFTRLEGLVRFFAFCSIFCLISLRYYFLVLNCQPFAEELNVYIDSALHNSFWKNMLVKDAGYLAIIQHIIAWIYVHLFYWAGIRIVSLAMNITGILMAAFCFVFPIGRLSEKILPRLVMFEMSIAIPTVLVRQYESFLFLNFIYFTILLYIALIDMDFKTMKTGVYIICIVVSGLMVLSKGFFVVLFPASVIGFFYNYKKDRRKMFWHMVIMISALYQLGVYFLGNTQDHAPIQFSLINITQIWIPLQTMGKILTGIFVPYMNFLLPGNCIVGTIYVVICGFAFLYLYRRRLNDRFFLFLQVMVTLFSSISLASLGTPFMYQNQNLAFSRQEFFGIIMLICSISMLFEILKEWKENDSVACIEEGQNKYSVILDRICGIYIVICCLVLVTQIAGNEDKFWIDSPNTDAFSIAVSQTPADFGVYGSYISENYFYIPSSPEYWFYAQNCDLYLYSNARDIIFWRTGQTYTAEFAEQILENRPYASFNPGELTERLDGLMEIFINKSSLQYEYEIMCFDKQGNLLDSARQLNDKRKRSVGFIFTKPIDNVYTIQFVDVKTKKSVTVNPEIICVYTEKQG